MPFKPFSLAESIQAGQAIKMNQLKIQQAEQGMARQERLRTLAQMSTAPTTEEYQQSDEQTFPGEAPIPGMKQAGPDVYSPEKHAQLAGQAGETELAAKLQDQISKMSKAQRDEAADKTEQIGRLAIWGDTPEKFAQAVQEAKDNGLMQEGQSDPTFEQRDMIIAQSQKTKDMLSVGQTVSKRGVSTTLQEIEYLESLPADKREDAQDLMMQLKGRNKLKKIGGNTYLVGQDGELYPLGTAKAEIEFNREMKEAETSAATEAKERTTAKLDLPAVKHESEYLKSVINKALNHPAFSSVVGMPSLGKMAKYVSGTPEAGFKALQDQIEGKTFMQAYKTLKGGGQITEIEGVKATSSLQRLKTSSGEVEYREAAEEFLSEIDLMTTIAEDRASGGDKYPRQYSTVKEAESANLPSGTQITIDGRLAVVE